MSRPKDDDAKGGRPGDAGRKKPRTPADPIKGYRPLGKPGPSSTLTEDMIVPIATRLASGNTYNDAAAPSGTTGDCLKQWLSRGKEVVAKGEENLYTRLLVEVANAKAHYHGWLLEQGHASIGDRGMSDKFVRWRLATSAPLDFTVPAAGAGPQASNSPLQEVATAQQALASLEEKLARFLELEDKRAAAEKEAATSGG